MDQGGYNLCHSLFADHILILTDVKRQINTYILIDHRTTVAFNGKPFFFKLIQVTAYGFLRDVIKLAEFADHNPLFFLQFC